MNITFPSTNAAFVKCVDCHATLARLVGNLSGFLYRRRLDPRWTMEFVSAGSRDITGYESHRFIANASIAFGDLIARSDWERVNERVRLAVLHRQRATVEYLIRTAHGAWLQVEDRFTPVVNAAGKALAIEGLIDRARCSHNPTITELSEDSRLAARCNSTSLN
jgi:PAS domain-containing protein